MVGYKDLQILSIEAHQIKTHAERHGMTYEEAKLDKQAIAIQDSKKDKQWLLDKGITPGKNAGIRKQQIIDYLRVRMSRQPTPTKPFETWVIRNKNTGEFFCGSFREELVEG